MIRFDLVCTAGHGFEGWFGSNDAYDEQRRTGVLTCPTCGTREVDKAIMAPAIANSRAAGPEARAKMAAMMVMMRKMQEHVRSNFENVGERFADEARKIHIGDAEARDIFGKATAEQASELRDEGIPFGLLPDLPEHDA